MSKEKEVLKPLTEKEHCFCNAGIKCFHKEDVLSAVELLKAKINNFADSSLGDECYEAFIDCLSEIDECFQIQEQGSDSSGKNGRTKGKEKD